MTTFTAPAHIELSVRIAAAKAAARKVLDLAAAGADTTEARIDAEAEARVTLGRIASFLEAQRDLIDRAEHEAVTALHMIGGASDEECRRAAAYDIGLDVTEI